MRLDCRWMLLPMLALFVEARDARAYRGGKAEYMKADRKGETQFQHQKTIDGAVLGCFGYVDGQGKMFVTHYLADVSGYRSVSLSAPDKITRDRLKLLRNGEDGPAADLFPVDCTEEGDLGKLQRMADKIKKEFESGNDDEEPQRKSPSYDKKGEPANPTEGGNVPKKSDNDSQKPKKQPSEAIPSEMPNKQQNVRLINVRDPSTFRKPVKKLVESVLPTRKSPTKPGVSNDKSDPANDSQAKAEPGNSTPEKLQYPKSSQQPNQVDQPQSNKRFEKPSEKEQDLSTKPNVAAKTTADTKNTKDDLAAEKPKDELNKDPTDRKQSPKSGNEPSKLYPETSKPEPKKESDKSATKNKKPNKDAKASEKPEDQQDDSNAEDELDDDSNDPKQSSKTGKEPSKADKESPKALTKKGSDDPKESSKSGTEPSKVDKESSKPEPKKGSDKPASKNKTPDDDAKASEKPEDQQDDLNAEDELDDDSNDPKQSSKSGKKPSMADKESSKPETKKGFDDPKESSKSGKEPSKADKESLKAETKKGSDDPKESSKSGTEPSKVDKEFSKPEPKKGSDKPASKNKTPDDDAKASEKPEDQQDDSNAEDELDDDSNAPKQSSKSGKEPSMADKESSKKEPKKGSDKPVSKNKKPHDDAKSSNQPDDQDAENEDGKSVEDDRNASKSVASRFSDPSGKSSNKGKTDPNSPSGPATREGPSASSLTNIYPTPPFEAELPSSGLSRPSDSNDVLPTISRVLPVNRDIIASLLGGGIGNKPPIAPKTAAPSATDGDVYDEVDDEEDTDSVDAETAEKQQKNEPEKPNQSRPEPTDAGSCIEIVLKVPTDARHVIVRTENPTFKTQDGASLNDLVNKIAPGVYDVQLAKFGKVVFEKYDKPSSEAGSGAPSNLGKAFNYDELVPKPRNSVSNARVPGDSTNAYLPKADNARSRVDVSGDAKSGKSARDENEPANQRHIPDRFLGKGRRG
ncbi:nucleolar protein dao-5-like isoform X5 [Anopheles funestus]|uniref:nucleolar protein dao-5-like isoform X5 n=1 Tax=Anopheles funestus TaxID=62324 RepID=UPI0020C5F0D8|nr:nucleolar protein dao-5-like isoform X5 [Anopheles funestus]